MSEPEEYEKIKAEAQYYKNQLAESHELLGRIVHQCSEKFDNLNLTRTFPTNVTSKTSWIKDLINKEKNK